MEVIKYRLSFFLFLSALCGLPLISYALIQPSLSQRMESANPDLKLSVNIVLKDQFPTQTLFSLVRDLPRPQRRAEVARILRQFSEEKQRRLLNYLKEKEREGKVSNIVSLWLVNMVGCYATRDVIAELDRMEDVAFIYYDRVPIDLPDVKDLYEVAPTDAIEWNITKVRAPQVWALGYKGEGVVVGIVDTGVRYTHYDLRNHLWNSTAYPNHGFNYASYQFQYPGHQGPSPYDSLTPLDWHGHGSHCAGTICSDGSAGDTCGVAPMAKLLITAIDAYIHSPYPDTACERQTMQAMQFCVSPPRDPENGADVVSMSIGWDPDWQPTKAVWRTVCENILAAGVAFAIAAGNEGQSATPNNLRIPGACPPPYPHPQNGSTGGLSCVISVGATDINDNLASFSSTGPSTWQNVPPWNDYIYPPGLTDPDISAPGVNITSLNYQSDNGYVSGWSGTSMATPHIAGAMALALSKNWRLTPRQLDSLLERHGCIDLGRPGKDSLFGAGRLDCESLIRYTPLPTGVRYYKHTILDTPPLGNGDGILNPGESCEMPTWVKNLCSFSVEGVWGILRRKVADPNVTISDSVKYFGTIPAGDSAWTGRNGFNITVAVACTNGYRLPLEIAVVDTVDSLWISDLDIRVGAPFLIPQGILAWDSPPGGNGNGRIDPGEIASIAVGIKNTGIGNAYNVTAILKSADSRFVILDSFGTYDTILHDTTKFNIIDKFRVQASSAIPREFPIPCTLKIYGLNYTAIRPFNIIVGEVTIADPIPDGPRTPPRYWAYDDIDTFYLEAPTYRWIELRNRGTQLPITSDDQTIRIPLPFVFKYYGQRYTDSLSVCGNGWISPIRTTSAVYTNQPLPDPTSSNPSAMICVNWDDLYPPVGNRIWYLYEPDSHRFILEWDSVHYYSAREQWDKFQIIVYDTTVSTYTGDNEIIFQYLTANNYISNTVGIEDGTNQIGINALYNTNYDRRCAPITARRAIKVTTDTLIMRVGITESPKVQGILSPMRLSTINRGKVELLLSPIRSSKANIVIYDIGGREVKRISLSPKVERIIWDGQDANGRRVSEGIYIIRLEEKDGKDTRKVVYLR